MDKFKEFYLAHKTGFWGAVIGLIVGILMIAVGFFKTLFVIICVLLGFIGGKLYGSDTPVGEKMRKFFSFRGGKE